ASCWAGAPSTTSSRRCVKASTGIASTRVPEASTTRHSRHQFMSADEVTRDNSPPSATPSGGMLKKVLNLAGDVATYGLSSVIGQVVQFFLLPIYTYYLTPKEYGISAMLLIVTMLFGPLANLGMTNAIFRRFNQAPNDAAGRVVLGTGLCSVIIG